MSSVKANLCFWTISWRAKTISSNSLFRFWVTTFLSSNWPRCSLILQKNGVWIQPLMKQKQKRIWSSKLLQKMLQLAVSHVCFPTIIVSSNLSASFLKKQDRGFREHLLDISPLVKKSWNILNRIKKRIMKTRKVIFDYYQLAPCYWVAAVVFV